MNGRFPIALHIMTLLCKEERLLSSDYMASSINVNPVLVRKELSNLIKSQLIQSREGKNGGYQLAKPSSEITLAGIYEAVKPSAILGQAKNQPNPKCPVGRQIMEHLNQLNNDVDQLLLQKLGDNTLQQFTNKFD